MKKVLALFLVVGLVLAALCGCAQNAAPATSTSTSATASATTTMSTTAGAFPVTVKDASGQDVVIKSMPQSIVSTNVWSAEMLLDLVSASRIKGLSAWGDNEVLSATADKAKAVTGRINTTEPESIVALKPDLVIIDTFSDPDGALTKTLTEAGAVVLQMASPTDFSQIRAAIATLAAATGEAAKGQAIIDEIDAKLKAVSDKLANLSEEKKLKVIYYEDYYDQTGSNAGMLAAYGKESPFQAVADAAGLVNVCTAPTYSTISKEKIIGEWKPDLLIVPAVTFGQAGEVVDDRGATVIEGIKADPLLKTLPAVQNNKIFALTEKYRGSTSQYMADVVGELAAIAYPELFK